MGSAMTMRSPVAPTPTACNYDATPPPTPTTPLRLQGRCLRHLRQTGTDRGQRRRRRWGLHDAIEVTGCTDSTACNYDATSTTDTDNTLCVFTGGCDTCSGRRRNWHVVDNDADDDGVCDDDESPVAPTPTACNYDATPPPTPTTPLRFNVDGCATPAR